MRILNKPGRYGLAAILGILYTASSILYFVFLDNKFYVRNLLRNDITFVVPVLYVILTGLFIYLYSNLLKEERKTVLYPIIAIAVLTSLYYFLVDLKIGMINNNPLGGNRGIYNLYSNIYFLFFISLFSLLNGFIFKKVLQYKISILHLVLFLYFMFFVIMLFAHGLILHSLYMMTLVLLTLLFKKSGLLLKKTADIIYIFLKNEKLLLICIFILSFLIRYFWGMRVLGLTGNNFLIASDDGPTYDSFAATMAQGGMISKSDVFYWSGFGYWYFLSAIYKMFGLHNFKAMITIQALLGALVPVFTYLIGKRLFNSKFVGILASLMTSFNLTLVFLSGVIGMEAVYIPLFMFAMTLATYFLLDKNLNYKKAFVLGAVFGLANNARSEVLFFPLILAVLIFLFLKDRLKTKKTISIIAYFFIGFVILMSIQHIVNYSKYGEYRLTSGALGTTFAGDWCFTNENMTLNSLGFNPFNDMAASIRVLLKDPFTVLGLISKGFLKRIIIYFFKPNFGVFDPIYLVNPGSGCFFRFPVWVQFYEYLFVLAGIFLAFIKKENLIAKTMLFIFAIYLSSMYSFVWVTNSRHRGVLIPIFVIFFAYGVEMLYKKIKDTYGIIQKVKK